MNSDKTLKNRLITTFSSFGLWFDLNYEFVGNKANGESQNGGKKKTKHAKFSVKWIFLTPWYTHLRKNVRFSENLSYFVFLLPPFWDLAFFLTHNELMSAILLPPSPTRSSLTLPSAFS